MISTSTLTTAVAEANTAELHRQAARRRAIAGMERELDSLARPRVRRSRVRLMLAAVAAAGVALFAASSAWADAGHYYASPAASFMDGGACQDPADPCTLAHALQAAPPNGDVELASGTYPVPATVVLTKLVTLHGPAAGPRPTILLDHSGCPTCDNVALSVEQQGTVLSDLRVVEAGGPGQSTAAAIRIHASASDSPTTLDHVVAEGDDDAAVWTQSSTVIRDSLIWAPNSGGRAVYAEGLSTRFAVNLENVDALAGGTALNVTDDCINNDCVVTTTVGNSILEGGVDDVSSNGHGAGPHLLVTLSHSNYRLHSPDDWITSPGVNGNQVDYPGFVAPESGDFHENPTSPTVNAGTSTGLTSSTDFDGTARLSGSAPDIGAFELQEAAPSAPPASAGPSPGQPTGGGSGTPIRHRFAGVHIGGGFLTVARGKVGVRVSCPAGASGTCTGTLTLTKAGTGSSRKQILGSARFHIAAGKSKQLSVKISRAALRSKRLRALATVVASDSQGTTQTTAAAVKIRRG